MDKLSVISEIKSFLDGYDDTIKYLVHVETDSRTNIGECIIHPPGKDKYIEEIPYTPFLYVKDFEKNGIRDFYGNDKTYMESQKILHGITYHKLETGGQERLEKGYIYKVTSSKSYSHLLNFFKDGGVYAYQKLYDGEGNVVTDKKGDPVYPNRHLFYTLRLEEQFLIDKKTRLFKGIEEYNEIHRFIFDIETTGLRPEISRVFAIGIRDNKGFETILEVDKLDDDESEIKLIQDFFNLIYILKPDIIAGYNSEEFDFMFILDRSKILKMDLSKIRTSFKDNIKIRRRPNSTVKIGTNTERYTSTIMWGTSVVDILHAAKKTAALNTDIKKVNLKYIADFEGIARPNRTYIKGDDNGIGDMYYRNSVYLTDNENNYIEIPEKYQDVSKELILLQKQKKDYSEDDYKKNRNNILKDNKDFVDWFRENALSENKIIFKYGRELLRQYLLDDIWETEQVDLLYSQSSFMLTKIVPTVYQKICTMGTASIWNLLLTAWSFEKNIAIPVPDVKQKFSGGLSRCFKTGYTERIVKIDYASLYPMEQLTWDIFPIFDITGVMKMMLLYMTTTRNIYKKLANSSDLNIEEIELLKELDPDVYIKYKNNTLTDKDRSSFKVKQLPIKILNNSQFGALGSDISFNWSYNISAARITSNGRLNLRQGISWFPKYGCIPLLAITDGINFKIPNTTNIRITDEREFKIDQYKPIEVMWEYGGDVGIAALINKYNKEQMIPPYMSVDNDGEFLSCLNLSRNNYALLVEKKNKKTGEIKKQVKLIGNTIKSVTMPEYIEDFMNKGFDLILNGKGYEFVQYYNDYVDDIYYRRIPLKKIANKSRFKYTIDEYKKRGKDKNGKDKAQQAHMELVIKQRKLIAEELFEKHKNELDLKKDESKLTVNDKMKLIAVYMPPEPELDSMIYYVNTGYRKSHGDSKIIKDKKTGKKRMASRLISVDDLRDNPDMLGEYNVDKYLDKFNKRITNLLIGFKPEIREKIFAKIVRTKKKNETTNKNEEIETLKKGMFTRNELEMGLYDLDSLEDTMSLSSEEINFWNFTGYDPRLVWNGFKERKNKKIYYDIYNHALEFLNKKMKKTGKPLIKSVNDKINKGDYILYKYGKRYELGYHNGKYIQIIRKDLAIPKSEIEIELEYKEKKKQDHIKISSNFDIDGDEYKERLKFFEIFKNTFNIEKDFNTYLNETGDDGIKILDDFIQSKKDEEEEYV